MEPKLLLDDRVVFTCQNSGACCRNVWLIGVDRAAHERLRKVDWSRVDPALPSGEKFVPLAGPLPGGEAMTFARTPAGACVFLTPEQKCSIHANLGGRAKPQICREFPYHFVRTPDGVAVGVSFACTAVRGHQGAPLAAQRAEILDVLSGSTRVRTLPEPLSLYAELGVTWEEYQAIEEGLLAILADTTAPLPRALIGGSALISVCVGLAQLEANARRAERPADETLLGGLAKLRDERYRRILAIAGTARYPARPSLVPLAPLWTWLEFSARRLGRAGLVVALYRNWFRFWRGRGSLPDLVTGGAPVPIEAVRRVHFDADHPAIGPLLREYWSHVVFRKTLTPMHGVFRGYQTMLALYALMKWVAKLGALRAGRPTVAPADVRDAVRLVEQRFVLHARFADLFDLHPLLTAMADRLYRQPAFVRGAALEPPRNPVE
ncbi:MAG: YkgJ family cysteine cluster protein [Candidatus Rokuibacteriota bacterium]